MTDPVYKKEGDLSTFTPTLSDKIRAVTAGGVSGNILISALLSSLGIAQYEVISGVVYHKLWIAGWKPTVTNGCAASAQIEMATNKNVYDYLAFDPSTIQYAYANFLLPYEYTGGVVYAKFVWMHPETTTNFGVSWGLQGVCIADGATLDVAQGVAGYVNDVGGNTSYLYISPMSGAITLGGTPAAGKLCQLRSQRYATDATNDTLAVNAYLLGVMLYIPVV